MADEIWYYEKDGEQKGPVSREELQALIASGEISRENLAWHPGEAEWNETGSFEVLIPSFQTPPPPPEPAPPPPPPPPPPPESSSPQASVEGARRPRQKKSGARPPFLGGLGGALLGLFYRFRKLVLRFFRWVMEEWWRQAVGTVTTVALVYYGLVCRPPTPPPPKEPPAFESILRGTVVPVGYTGPVGQIKIDPSPWAEVVSLKSASLGELAIPGSRSTPLVLLVPPGKYTIDLENPSKTERCELEIAREESRRCSKVIRTIDAATYYREVGW